MKTAAMVLAIALLSSPAGAHISAAAINPDMARIFAGDQADRRAKPDDKEEIVSINWSVVSPRDRVRRAETRRLLDASALKTGDDFRAAAFVFQHGETSDDILMAHTLAMVAVAKGKKDALWIAAAALDRYLMRVGQPQVYGTQYTRSDADRPWTQEPFNPALVSDALRAELGVPPLAEQQKRLAILAAQSAAPAPR